MPLGINSAYAKMTPSSRPDIEINVLMAQEEGGTEEGTSVNWDYITNQTFNGIGEDFSKLPMTFELIAKPAVMDFFNNHKSDLAGNYIDTLFVRYRPQSQEVLVSTWYSQGLYENMTAGAVPEKYALKFIDEVSFKIAILKQFPSLDKDYQSWVDFNILEYNIMPLSSIRVAYLADRIEDMYSQNKGKLLKDDSSISLPEKEPIILESVSAVMFQEMSRLDISYMDRPVGFYSGRITGYDTEASQLVSLRSSGSTIRVPLKPNEPILYFKPLDQAIKLHATVHTYGNVSDALLVLPDEEQIWLKPMNAASVKYDDLGATLTIVDFEYSLDSNDATGIYRITIQLPAPDVERATVTANLEPTGSSNAGQDDNGDELSGSASPGTSSQELAYMTPAQPYDPSITIAVYSTLIAAVAAGAGGTFYYLKTRRTRK